MEPRPSRYHPSLSTVGIRITFLSLSLCGPRYSFVNTLPSLPINIITAKPTLYGSTRFHRQILHRRASNNGYSLFHPFFFFFPLFDGKWRELGRETCAWKIKLWVKKKKKKKFQTSFAYEIIIPNDWKVFFFSSPPLFFSFFDRAARLSRGIVFGFRVTIIDDENFILVKRV